MSEIVERVARAISEADAGFGYSFNLTRLVDGVATHTLKVTGFDPVDFEDRDDGYQLIEERRNSVRARAILTALREPTREMLEATYEFSAWAGEERLEEAGRLAWQAAIDAALAPQT